VTICVAAVRLTFPAATLLWAYAHYFDERYIMKVVVGAQNADRDALVDPRFGRARWFLVTDLCASAWEAHANETSSSGGAGSAAGDVIVALGAQALITGHVGARALSKLTEAGVTVYQVDNGVSAREAVAALGRQELPALRTPTIGGPWS
jgi:predicted Fe-Mo cluster-binding NifX family protein